MLVAAVEEMPHNVTFSAARHTLKLPIRLLGMVNHPYSCHVLKFAGGAFELALQETLDESL